MENNNVNYLIMDETNRVNGNYKADYDKLIAQATSEEEKTYLQEVKKHDIPFAYNMVYVTKQTCGHYEIFQTPQNEYHSLEGNLLNAQAYAEIRKCTRCICGWNK